MDVGFSDNHHSGQLVHKPSLFPLNAALATLVLRLSQGLEVQAPKSLKPLRTQPVLNSPPSKPRLKVVHPDLAWADYLDEENGDLVKTPGCIRFTLDPF